MNQTKKRLSIINLAISITDIETIQLQISKLRLLHADTKIQEIISVLQEESYAKAQGLIASYIDLPTEEVIQRASQNVTPTISKEDQDIIEEFQLLVSSDTDERVESQIVNIDINDYYEEDLKITREDTTNHTSIDFDSLLNIDPEDVLTDNIKLDISDKKSDTFFEFDTIKNESIDLDTTTIPKDTFFDHPEMPQKEVTKPHKDNEIFSLDNEDILLTKDLSKKPFPSLQRKKVQQESYYKAIPDLAQKVVSLKKQYPPVQITYEEFTTAEALLTKITHEGYTETKMDETFSYIAQLVEKANYAEATQLLLVCAATESKFAQLMLARALFKGVILQKDIPEAFALMKQLAQEDYPEALCDLGQFYENGIGTTENKIKAEALYKESSKSGIKRAKKHHTRLKKQNRGFFKN